MNTTANDGEAGRRSRQPERARALRQVLAHPPAPDAEDPGEYIRSLASALLEDAARENASDVHLDPVEGGYEVRFRVDGVLVNAAFMPPEEGLHVLRSFKSRADLDPGFSLLPQDGRAVLPTGNGEISARVSTGPGVRGEKLALRILPHALTRPPLDQLGLSVVDHQTVTTALRDVRGMIVISGPTGSGKTTTLYALVRELGLDGRSIVSIEDPVEYALDGVTQIEVNERQGLTFGEGVKGLLRLDPDVLVLGEMRDAVSARAALDAADSGHVFLSTLHARDAAGSLSVLRHLGLVDHEIAATVDLLVAQRLVRRLCRACRKLEAPAPVEAEWLRSCGEPVPDRSWRAVGCAECSGSGYRGRVGIFEIHRLREEDADLILAHADEHTLRRQLRGQGAPSLFDDALQKIAEGLTSIAEFRSIGGMGFFRRKESNDQRKHSSPCSST